MERPARPALASQNIDNMLNSRAEFTVPRRLGPTVQVRDAMITFRPAAVNHGSAPDLSVVHPSRSEPHPPSSISFEKTSAGPRRYVKSSPRFSKGRRRRSRRCARPRPAATRRGCSRPPTASRARAQRWETPPSPKRVPSWSGSGAREPCPTSLGEWPRSRPCTRWSACPCGPKSTSLSSERQHTRKELPPLLG